MAVLMKKMKKCEDKLFGYLEREKSEKILILT